MCITRALIAQPYGSSDIEAAPLNAGAFWTCHGLVPPRFILGTRPEPNRNWPGSKRCHQLLLRICVLNVFVADHLKNHLLGPYHPRDIL